MSLPDDCYDDPWGDDDDSDKSAECLICGQPIDPLEAIECENCGELFCSGSCFRRHGC